MLAFKEKQTEIDSLYDSVCDVYYAEMKALLNNKDVGPASQKEVDILLNHFGQTNYLYYGKTLKNLKKIFLQSKKQRNRKNQLQNFQHNQHLFNREFRKAKIKYNREIQCNIENLNSNRPTKLWEEVYKLGPAKKDSIPLEVYNSKTRS